MTEHGGWIGVDLDGTLAFYDGWVSPSHIGEPIRLMLDRVRLWVSEGRDVRIFTARVGSKSEAEEARLAIQRWCLEHVGQVLPVTNEKDMGMIELWDDRVVQVIENTGVPVGAAGQITPWVSRRGLS